MNAHVLISPPNLCRQSHCFDIIEIVTFQNPRDGFGFHAYLWILRGAVGHYGD